MGGGAPLPPSLTARSTPASDTEFVLVLVLEERRAAERSGVRGAARDAAAAVAAAAAAATDERTPASDMISQREAPTRRGGPKVVGCAEEVLSPST